MTSFAPDTAAIRRAWHGSATAVIPFLARRFQAVLPAFLSSKNPCARTPALEPESRPAPDLGRMVRFSPHAASSNPPAARERASRPAVLTGWIRRSRSNSLQPPHRDRASPARAPRVLRRARLCPARYACCSGCRSASHIGSNIKTAAVCTTGHVSSGFPGARCPPFALSRHTRRTGAAR